MNHGSDVRFRGSARRSSGSTSRWAVTPLVLPSLEEASLEVGHALLADEHRPHKEHPPTHGRQPHRNFPLAPRRDRQEGHHEILGINPKAQRHQHDAQPKREPLRWPSELHNVSGRLPPSVAPIAQRDTTCGLGSSSLGTFTRPDLAWVTDITYILGGHAFSAPLWRTRFLG